MKPVRCSWVDMLKIREALSSGDRGSQQRLEKMRCVDKGTVSTWKATCDIIDVSDGKVDLSQLSVFQPTHARELARTFRKRHGKKSEEWSEEVGDEIVDWIDRVESESLTVEQLRLALLSEGKKATAVEPCHVGDLQNLAGKQYGTIYADPPWQYDNQTTRAATSNHYKTMTVDEIAAMPIADLAADEAHLFIWTTGTFLPHTFRIIEAWGFDYKTYVVWCKPQIGIGNYFRKSTELMLVANRGGLQFSKPEKRDWFDIEEGPAVVQDRLKHSQKPEEFRKIIEEVSSGPYLELFARCLADNWTAYGNEIEKSMFDTDAKEIGQQEEIA